MIFMAHGIDDATLTVTTGTAHASYPVDNLKSRVIGKLFKTSTDSQVVVKIDFGAARSCNAISLINSNYDDSCTIKYGTADNGSDFENTAGSNFAPDPDQWGFYTSFLAFEAGAVSKRYWQLDCDNWGTVNYLGGIYLGAYYETPYNCGYSFGRGYSYGIQSNVTRGGIDLRYRLHAKKYIEQNLKFQGFSDAQVDTFLAYFNDSEKCYGTLYPFVFLPDGETFGAHVGYFTNKDLVFKKITGDYNEITLGIVQQL